MSGNISESHLSRTRHPKATARLYWKATTWKSSRYWPNLWQCFDDKLCRACPVHLLRYDRCVPPQPIRHYFVDEAGDPVLFSGGKKIIVGAPGCSSYFIVGKVDIENPDELSAALDDLRQQLLLDPYFTNVPSMQVGQKKNGAGFSCER